MVEDGRSVPQRAYDAVRLGGPERPLYECPMCGLGVDRYDTACSHCGHDVTSSDALKDPDSFESWRHHYLNGGLIRGPFPWVGVVDTTADAIAGPAKDRGGNE